MEKLETVVELVAADGELAGAAQPARRLRAHDRELFLVGPREVGVLRSRGFRVVMREQRCELVPATDALEPFGKRGVKPRAPRFRNARVRDLARQLMLERELPLALHRGTGAVPDEVALFQQREVRLLASEQLADGAGPEDSPGDRSGL